MLMSTDKKAAQELAELAQQDVTMRWKMYEQLAKLYETNAAAVKA
jgi:hypothetical protein